MIARELHNYTFQRPSEIKAIDLMALKSARKCNFPSFAI